MKKRLLAALTAGALLLSGCAALLEQDYLHVTPHNPASTAEGDPSVLKAESYQGLVNALMHLITQGSETGTIRLYSDKESVEADLEAACLEVVQEDPLGAYAVDFIKYSVNSIVSYAEADVQITYRRTREQVASIVSATGTAAIRSELEAALAAFAPERVLRISYFDGDEAYIRALFQEAYYATPAAALDLPEIAVSIYPDQGRQRIVEIALTYQLETQELVRRRDGLADTCQALTQDLTALEQEVRLTAAIQAVLDNSIFDPSGGSTAYHALVEGRANSQGLSLAMAALCQELAVDCQVVSGTLNGEPHFWAVVQTQEGWRHLDLTQPEAPLLTDAQAQEVGYAWDAEAVPACLPLPEGTDLARFSLR